MQENSRNTVSGSDMPLDIYSILRALVKDWWMILTAGLLGATVATIAIALPSFLIIFLISTILDNFLEIRFIANAFKGIKIGVGLLILSVSISMVGKMPKKRLSKAIALCACVAMLVINFLSLNISSITLMLIAGMVSLTVYLCGKKGGVVK